METLYARNEMFNKKTLINQQKVRVHAALQAYWSVAFKNISDNVLAVMNEELIEGTANWIKESCQFDRHIQECASEPLRVTEERQKCTLVLRDMKTCLRILDEVA